VPSSSSGHHKKHKGGHHSSKESKRQHRESKSNREEPAWKANENALNREKERFLCPFTFRNGLPAIAPEPKFLSSDARRMLADQATYATTDLERELAARPPVYVDAELQQLLNPFEITRLAIPAEGAPPLHPDDAALLSDDVSNAKSDALNDADPKTGVKTFKRIGAKPKTEVQWLFRTQYIAHGLTDGATHGAGGMATRRRHTGNDEEEGKTAAGAEAEEAAAKAEANGDVELAAEIRAIDASFRAANDGLPKPPKPGLTAVSVTPVLPDLEWFDVGPSEPALMHAVFVDDDPMGSDRTCPSAVRDKPEETRKNMGRNALAFPYTNQLPDKSVDTGMCLCVPRSGATSDVGAEADYDWIREYEWKDATKLKATIDVSERQRQYRMLLPLNTPDAANQPAYYSPMYFRIELKKKKKARNEGRLSQDALPEEGTIAVAMAKYRTPRPSVVKVKRRRVEAEDAAGGEPVA